MSKRKWSRLLAIALSVMLMVGSLSIVGITASAASWDGTVDTTFTGYGTQSNPYQITSAAELAGLASKVNNGTNYMGTYFKLTVDIALNDTSNWEKWSYTVAPANKWTPIGGVSAEGTATAFAGTFDGDNHTISGIYIATDKSYQGLFGTLGQTGMGALKNLKIDKSYIQGYSYVGAIAGMGYGTITNCTNAGKVVGTGTNVGGVVGTNNAGSTVSSILGLDMMRGLTNCTNTGAVTGVSYVGGVLGYSNGMVTGCKNSGRVNGNSRTGTNIGGVVGCNLLMATSCSNSGTVSGHDDVGGVIGYNNGVVSGSHNTGAVQGAANYIGGIVGDNQMAVLQCYNTGKVSGVNDVGGLVGHNCGSLSTGYNTGVVSGAGSSYNVGGLAGYNVITISLSDLTKWSDVAKLSKTLIGGIGNCYNTAAVSGNSQVGGLVGQNGANIQHCYTIGKATGSSNIGLAIGSNSSSASYCYYMSDLGGNGVGTTSTGSLLGGSVVNPTGLTRVRMLEQNSYEDFDFIDVWEMGKATGYYFPTLKGMTPAASSCNHSFELLESKPGTCAGDGYQLYVCKYCSYSYEVPVKGGSHNYGPWTVTKAATCTTAGLQTHTCVTCGHIETQAVLATGHKFGSWTTSKAATCTASGTEKATCSVCGETKTRTIPALGHSFSQATVTKQATCTAAGEESGYCTRCHQKTSNTIPALGHKYGAWTVKKAATCTAAGVEKHECTRCGHEETQSIPAKGHIFDNPKVVRTATIYQTGLVQGKCKICGAANASQVIPCYWVDPVTGIRVETDEGVFLEGTEMHIERILDTNTNYKSIKDSLYGLSRTFEAYHIYATRNGEEVQPKGNVRITFAVPEGYGSDTLICLIHDDASIAKLETTASTEDNTITGVFSELGICAVAKNEESAMADDPANKYEEEWGTGGNVEEDEETNGEGLSKTTLIIIIVAVLLLLLLLLLLIGYIRYQKKQNQKKHNNDDLF